MKRYLYALFAVIAACFLFFTGCSDNSEPILVTVEPSCLNINDIPPYITVTIKTENPDETWRIQVRIIIQRHDGNDWIEVYDTLDNYGFGRPQWTNLCELQPFQVLNIPTHTSPYHYHSYHFDASVAGRYRVVSGGYKIGPASLREFYAEFTISESDKSD